MEFFKRENIFDVGDPASKIPSQEFLRELFPSFHLVERDNVSEKEEASIVEMQEQQSSTNEEAIKERLAKLEDTIKVKFGTKWENVRKAFLDLDGDYDGWINEADFLKVFETESEKIDLKDLTKLIKEKGSDRKGYLSMQDFSKWLGGAIHWSEGFFFRHDSAKNPHYEQ